MLMLITKGVTIACEVQTEPRYLRRTDRSTWKYVKYLESQVVTSKARITKEEVMDVLEYARHK